MLYRGLQSDTEALKKCFLSCRHFSEGAKINCRELECNTFETPYSRSKSEWLIEKTKYIELLEQIEYGDEEAGGVLAAESEEDRLAKNRSVVTFSEDYTRIEA